MALFDVPIATMHREPSSLAQYKGKPLLLVNVASKCGLTPQYERLDKLQETFGDQERGTPEEIATLCSTTYGVTFPMFEKIDVNGEHRHPIYEELTKTPDAEGNAGDIQWNFEKFLVSPSGEVVARFRPRTDPQDPAVIEAITANLPG